MSFQDRKVVLWLPRVLSPHVRLLLCGVVSSVPACIGRMSRLASSRVPIGLLKKRVLAFELFVLHPFLIGSEGQM